MNNTNLVFLLVGVIVLFILFNNKNNKEHYSAGALTQLFAKGPEDTYLSGDAWKYIPYGYYYGWGPFYAPTRFSNSYYSRPIEADYLATYPYY